MSDEHVPFHVYILQSQSTGKIYVGQTNDLEKRLRQHNDPNFRLTLHTKRNKGPWALVHAESVDSRKEALKREKFLKSGQGREWIRDHILNQEAGGC